MIVPHHLKPPPPPHLRYWLLLAITGNLPETKAKKYPLYRENGNTHAAPSCIQVGGGGRDADVLSLCDVWSCRRNNSIQNQSKINLGWGLWRSHVITKLNPLPIYGNLVCPVLTLWELQKSRRQRVNRLYWVKQKHRKVNYHKDARFFRMTTMNYPHLVKLRDAELRSEGDGMNEKRSLSAGEGYVPECNILPHRKLSYRPGMYHSLLSLGDPWLNSRCRNNRTCINENNNANNH